ncbi:MAG: hypothetical protein J5767_00080 [Paludibacteraceae bacterium]|nr:hypothetical protein [Paludibacteraceae bacterium]
MATKYSDFIDIRQQKAAYNIQNEADGDWKSFIANEQFNGILKKVLASVHNNDADMHKSFWVAGTYGTGKSHAGAVIKHLLCDPVSEISDYVNEEYADMKYEVLRNDIFAVRNEIRLFPIMLYGHNNITHKEDLSLVLQRSITDALKRANIQIAVKTDFDSYVEHIEKESEFWENLIKRNAKLQAVAPDIQKLKLLLQSCNMQVLDDVRSALRDGGFDIRIGNANIAKWIFEVQDKLAEQGEYKGLFIIWDEFTDVMTSPLGLSLLVALQQIDEQVMNSVNNSYFFYISHPSALNSLKIEEREKTKGRYHYMSYNMERVSAFKIMSSKFKYVGDKTETKKLVNDFYATRQQLLDVYSQSSSNPEETREDLQKLFPIHPSTANLATYYASEVGSSSRSVFEFIGQNEAIRAFLDNEQMFAQKNTITADYLWDYVLSVFNENAIKYGAITERFHSRKLQVENKGHQYYSVFKSILLLNALYNLQGRDDNTITPTIDNIRNLFVGTSIENELDGILSYLDENSIIQRQPGDVYSIQFSALPTKEIEDIKNHLTNSDFRFTSKVIAFGETARTELTKSFKNVNRAYSFEMYSVDTNEYTMLNKIENGFRDARSYATFLALMFAKNTEELNTLKNIATQACSEDRFKNVAFIVFETPMGNDEYERFIEYQANASCAQKHNLPDQQKAHTESSAGMIKEWLKNIRHHNFTYYLNGEQEVCSVNKIVSTINNEIAPRIFNKGAESLELIKTRSANSYWTKQSAAKVVDTVLSYNTKSDIVNNCGGQYVHVNFLLQDSVDENLEWKFDHVANHPLKLVSDFIDNKLHTNRNESFNLADKLNDLTKPPYGLYQTAGNMSMVAFAMRKYINQIFDTNGKPRSNQHVADDVVTLFKYWEDGKGYDKLVFRFESKESRSLCKNFIDLFKLKTLGGYGDVSSLTDARWAITHEFSKKVKYPLWSLKYNCGNSADIQKLIDNILKICGADNMRDPQLLSETILLIEMYRFEFGNLLNNNNNEFETGFFNYLKSNQAVGIKDSEFETSMSYLRQHLQGEIGMWTENEVKETLLEWRISTQTKSQYIISANVEPDGSGTVIGDGTFDEGSQTSLVAMPNDGYEFEKWSDGEQNYGRTINVNTDASFTALFRKKKVTKPAAPAQKDTARTKVKQISDINTAKALLERIIDKADDSIINIINEL